MLRVLCKIKKVDTVIEVLQVMNSGGYCPPKKVYSDIIKGIAATGMREEAVELQQKLIALNVLKEEAAFD
ncbi:hypothetical protein RHGRI_025399 [Rhododendron griersonianum]|uniref:Pentatricopeptide repeat-containing protein n=1 Tax=Rhododendron griersonianum TaxID=479676 RepID=A0AAV6ISJ2_9ERIC|nr:hypothetical protein RHGRI_025399 [Rhododendron griersonianum]